MHREYRKHNKTRYKTIRVKSEILCASILKPIWFLAFQKTKSWLQLSPDWKTPRTFPGQKAPRTLLGQNCFWIYSENYFEMGIKY
jgi:hypothetical protein